MEISFRDVSGENIAAMSRSYSAGVPAQNADMAAFCEAMKLLVARAGQELTPEGVERSLEESYNLVIAHRVPLDPRNFIVLNSVLLLVRELQSACPDSDVSSSAALYLSDIM